MASALLSNWRRKDVKFFSLWRRKGLSLFSFWRRQDVCSKPAVITCKPRSLNDLPDEILLKILSYFRPEELCFIIAKVCERWHALGKDKALWKTLSYQCNDSSDISLITEVRYTTLVRFRTNNLMNFAPSSGLK